MQSSALRISLQEPLLPIVEAGDDAEFGGVGGQVGEGLEFGDRGGVGSAVVAEGDEADVAGHDGIREEDLPGLGVVGKRGFGADPCPGVAVAGEFDAAAFDAAAMRRSSRTARASAAFVFACWTGPMSRMGHQNREKVLIS